MKPVAVIFARAPRLGTVKRRLAAGIGPRAALRFHTGQLSATLRKLGRDRRFATVLAITPFAARGPWRAGTATIAQARGDLGRRMAEAFRKFPRRPVALVGCDIPELRANDVAQALRAVRSGAAAFGPAADGGYWLVAMGGRRPARPFAGVAWSTASALADTLRNFRGRRVVLLRTLSDVDTAADFHRRTGGR